MTKKTKNKILYIDAANSIDDIRIAEKSIWVEEIPKHGYDVHYLLMSSRNSRIKTSTTHGVTVTRRSRSFLISYLIFFFQFLRVIRKFKPKFVVIRNRFDLAILVYPFCWVFKIRTVYIKAFPLIESMLSKVSNKIHETLINCTLKWEIYLMQHSNLLIVRSKAHKKYLSDKYNFHKDSLIIPMGINTTMIKKIDETAKIELKRMYNLNKPYISIYFGALGEGRKIDFIVDMVHEVSKIKDTLNFLIVGGSEEEISNLKKKTQGKHANICFTGIVPREHLFKLLQIADFSISAVPPQERFLLLSPTKMFESMAFGCPVLANKEIVEQKEIIEQSNGGILHSYNKQEFVDTIIQILNEEVDLKAMGEKGRRYIIENRSYSNMANEIVKQLKLVD